MRRRRLFSVVTVAWALAAGSPAAAEEGFDVAAEIAAARGAIEEVHGSLGGMGGLGVISEADLAVIHGLLNDAERLVREARRRAQAAETVQDEAWVVGYARAGRAMALVAEELRVKQGYQ